MTELFVALCSVMGAFLQRVCGFGFGTFVMVFFPYLVASYGQATALSGIANIGVSLSGALSGRNHIQFKQVILPTVCATAAKLICIPIVAALSGSYTHVMKKVLGVMLVILAVYFIFFSKKIRIKPTPFAGVCAGFLAGVFDGFFAMGGPPAVIYFLALNPYSKENYHATIQCYFLFSGLVSLVIRACSGLITGEILYLAVFGIAGMLVGTLCGRYVFGKLSVKNMRFLIYIFMAVSGIISALS